MHVLKESKTTHVLFVWSRDKGGAFRVVLRVY